MRNLVPNSEFEQSVTFFKSAQYRTAGPATDSAGLEGGLHLLLRALVGREDPPEPAQVLPRLLPRIVLARDEIPTQRLRGTVLRNLTP